MAENSKLIAGRRAPDKFEPRFNKTSWALLIFVVVMVGGIALTGLICSA